jgi:nitrate reductase NapAB chaperone NapD
MLDEIHIASYVLRFNPGDESTLRAFISTVPQIEIVELSEADNRSGKMIVLIETRNARSMMDTVDAVRDQPGVLSIFMVEQHIDTEQSMLEAVIQ